MNLFRFIDLSEQAQQNAIEAFRAQDWSNSSATNEEIKADLAYETDDLYTEKGTYIPDAFTE